MNTIIKSSLAVVLSAIALQVSAQGVVVKKTDGTRYKVSYADLDCIETYTAEEEAAGNALVEAFANGGEYTVEADVTLDEPLVLKAGTELVLNLNGKKIINQLGNPSTDVIVVEEGATLTINGDGYVEAVSGNDGYPVISKGVVTINGGTFTSGTDAAGAGNACIYARDNGKIYITGGEFHSAEGALMINKKDEHRETTVIEITGGSYYGFNPADNGSETSGGGRGHGTNFVKSGYEVTENNDVFTVSEIATTEVATVAEIAVALEKGENVKLTESLELTATDVIEVAEGSTALINLNGNTLTINEGRDAGSVDALVNKGTMTLINGKVVAANSENTRRCVYNYGTMVIDNVEFTQQYETKGAAINNEGKMTIKSATVNAIYYSIWNSGENAEMTIDGGTYTTTNNVNNRDTWSYCVNSQNGAKLTINGGSFVGNHGVIGAVEGATVTLNGGSYHCTATYTGNSDWTLYASAATIEWNSANCTVTSDNTLGVSTTQNEGVITKK